MSRIAHAALWLTLLMVLSTTAAPLNMSNENVGMNAPGGGGGEGNLSVTLTYPTGGEVFNAGDDVDILFHNSGLTEILVELKLDSTTAWITLGTRAMNPNDSSWWEWTVPNHPTTTAQVRVSSASDATINDIGDHFTILGGGPCDNVSRNVVQWDSTVAANPGYAAGTPVEYTLMSGNVWVSLIDNNGNIPGAGDGWVLCTCEELANGNVWSSNTAYGTGDVVAHNGMFWISAFSPNNGNEPGVYLDAWRPCIDQEGDPCENANGSVGPWYDQSVIYYSLGDVVEYPAGSGDYYVSNRDQNSAHPTDGSLRGWDPCNCSDLSDGTTWQSGNAYSAYKIVEHNGVLYVKKDVNVVALGGDPEPGVAKGWTIFWRLCEPGNCTPVGVWNQAHAAAGYYDVGVVVKTVAWSATKWVSTVEDNALSPAFGNGWTWCKTTPWHPVKYFPGPVAPPPVPGGKYINDTDARLMQGTTLWEEDYDEGRDTMEVACREEGCTWVGKFQALLGHIASEHAAPADTTGGGIIFKPTPNGIAQVQDIGKVCADLTLDDPSEYACFEQRVITGGDTSTGGCWTDSDGLATWNDDCGDNWDDVHGWGDHGNLTVSEHPPIVTGTCDDEALAEVGVLISDSIYDSADVGGHLLVEATGAAPSPECGAVVTIAAADLPSLEEIGTDGRVQVSCSYRETCSWTGDQSEYEGHMATHDGHMHPGPTSDGGMVYSYVITSSDGTNSTTYHAMNFVGLTCDAIDIEGVVCNDAVIIEAHADHDCGEGCPICDHGADTTTSPPVDNGSEPEEEATSLTPGFSLIMAMCALLSAVIIRRRPE